MIRTGDTYFRERAQEEPELRVKGLPTDARSMIRARQQIARTVAAVGVADMPPLRAYVNWGRWVVDCPFCNSAAFVWEDGLFFCMDCKNRKVEGKPVIVLFPSERYEIERLLNQRHGENQNWRPGETMEYLAKSNLKYLRGVEV